MRGRVFRKGFSLTALAVFLMPAFILCSQSNLQAAVDFTNLVEISSQVTIIKSAARYNRSTRTFFFRINITNPGPDTFSQPIVAVIDDLVISNPSYNVTFMDTDDMLDIDSDGYINPVYIVSNTHLAPGASVYKNIQVAFRDASGNLVRPCPFRFTIQAFATQSTGDTTLPKISINYPLDASTIGTDTPKIIITYSDDDSGVNTGSLNALINTLDKSSLFTTTGLGAIYQTINEIAAGNNTIEVTLDDNAGNSGNATSNFTVTLSMDLPLYAFCLNQRNWIFQSPADGTYTQYPIPAGLDILDFYIQALHLASSSSGQYFSFVDEEGIYYSPGDSTYGLYMTSTELGVPGQYVDALYIDASNMIYFSVVGNGDILQSSGDDTNTTFMTEDDLGISGMDLDALYITTNGKVLFSVSGDGTILESSGVGSNAVYLNSSDLGVSGYDINAFSLKALQAGISASPSKGGIPLDVQFSALKDGGVPPYSYEWDLNGDGTIDDTRPNFSYIYQVYGVYNVTLAIKDAFGSSASDIITISALSAPTIIAAANPSTGGIPLDVAFSATVTDPDGTIVLYEWDFEGDGTYDWSSSTTSNTTHQYTSSGLYQATIRATDNDGLTGADSIEVTVGIPPTASASANPMSGAAPLDVSFTGTGTDTDGAIVLYEWDFEGDGSYDWSNASSGNTTHTYTYSGIFNATLRVTDDDGLNDTASVLISIAGPPIAKPKAYPISGEAPLTVTFFSDGEDIDGSPEYYDWDFNGDGTFDKHLIASMNTTYTYSNAGTYNAALKVTDNEGLTGTSSVTINVTAPPNPQGYPTANANAIPTNGGAPLDVVLLGSGTDPDGSITKYEWDFEGDGVYDWEELAGSYGNTISGFIYNTLDAGSYNSPAFVDIDNDGDMDTIIKKFSWKIRKYFSNKVLQIMAVLYNSACPSISRSKSS